METPEKIRILVVDRFLTIREGLAAWLSFQPDFEVIGEAGDGLQAIEAARKFKPDVVMLDFILPDMDGLAVMARIKEVEPGTRFLFFSMFAQPELAHRALKNGATGYLLKGADREKLTQAIRAVARHQIYLDPDLPPAPGSG